MSVYIMALVYSFISFSVSLILFLPVRRQSLGAEFGVELAELLVRPEEVGGVLDALPLHLQDEDVVLLGAVPLLDVLQEHLVQAAVGGEAEGQKNMMVISHFFPL